MAHPSPTPTLAQAREAKHNFLCEAQNLLDHVGYVVASDKKSSCEVEKMRMSLDLVKLNRSMMDDLLQRFVEKVRIRLVDDDFLVTQEVLNDITGSERIRICSARMTPAVTAAMRRCVVRMDSLVDTIRV
jgi:hypothetical protein